ncbi:MAG: isoprenylcysteine carboxylmethyltransferase family protein [Anaerolineae bacterium]|nr:isoprenylcysteine carboxylmethyltransferase family protein [Anaerolineae bacterium]
MKTTPISPKLLIGVALRIGLGIPFIALIIILPAGTWNYWQGWLYLVTLLLPMLGSTVYLFRNDPALLERRMRMREKESAQQKIIGFLGIYFLLAFTLPGFDVRLGWSNVPAWASILADGLVFAGYMITFWVLTVNSFLSRTVEVEAEQKVVSTGPYAIVRHPMYFGVALLYIASPLALGSYWAILPALMIIPLLGARIRNEEEVLLRELSGYAKYRQKVKYRLLPGIW